MATATDNSRMERALAAIEARQKRMQPTPDTLTLEYVEWMCRELNSWGEEDPERAHSLEKQIMQCFIVNIVAKKYTEDQASEIGKVIVKINNLPFPRWFA